MQVCFPVQISRQKHLFLSNNIPYRLLLTRYIYQRNWVILKAIKPTVEISSSGYDFSQKSRRQRKEGYKFSALCDSVKVMTHAHCSVIGNLVLVVVLGVGSKGPYYLLPGEKSRFSMFPIFRNGSFLVLVSQWKLRMGTYDWEQIQPSQLKETIFSTGFKFVFFLSLYSFSSSGSLRAVGLNALTVIELQKQEKRKPSHLDFCIDKRARAFLTRLKYIHAQDLIHRRQ